MEIHKPKHIHSWRELLMEIGVVVIGVGIALGAEQTVEWLHWRTQVTEAREFIASELAGNMRRVILRLRTSACTERRLDELAAILDGAARTSSLPPLGDIAFPPRGTWNSGAWESVMASQTATHFPRQLLGEITGTYKQVARLEQFSADEINAWNSLYAMVGPGRRLDPASEAKLREALGQARSTNRLMSLLSDQTAIRVKGLGLPFSAQDLDLIDLYKHQPLLEPGTIMQSGGIALGAICAPLGRPPSSYGQGMYGGAVAQINDALKTFPDFTPGAK